MPDELKPDASQTTPNNTATPPETGDKGDAGKEPDWLPGRLERAKASSRAELLKELGIDDPAAAKAALEEARKIKEGQMTEAQKVAAEAEKLKTKLQEAEAKAAAAEAARVQLLAATAVKSAASKEGAEFPEDVVEYATKVGMTLAGMVKEDGTVDDAQVKKLIEAAKKQRPNWFKSGGAGSPSNSGGKVQEPDKKAKSAAAVDQQRALRRRF